MEPLESVPSEVGLNLRGMWLATRVWGGGICDLRFAHGDSSFADLPGFGLGGPDRRAEDAGKLTIFLDEVLDQCCWGHPSFQNPKKNDK
jgi:hypothetical protein